MNKIIKGILIFCMFFLSLFSFKASASTFTTEGLNYYFTFITDRNTNLSNEITIYYIDGIPTYCIEPGVKLGDTYNNIGDLDHLDNDVKNKILDYMYYGYLYKNHTDKNYYAATQALIWEELLVNDQEVVFSTELFKKGNIIDLSSYKKEIINTINKHKGSVYGSGNKYYLLMGDTLTIEDTSGVYDDYNVQYDNNIINITLDSNKMIIDNANQVIDYDITLSIKNIHNQPYKVMHEDDRQDLLVIGNIPSTPLYTRVSVYGGTLVIIKHGDNGKIIPGVKFNLYDSDDNYIRTIKTSSNGEGYSMNNLKKGTYYIKEIETIPGYDLDEEKKYIEVTSSNNYIRVLVINHKLKATLNITKKDSDTDELINNTSIGIYDSEMNLIDTLITDEEGKVSIDLGYGKYYYKEIESNPDYILDDTLYDVMIDKSGIYDKTIYNKKIPEEKTVIEEPIIEEKPVIEEIHQEEELIIEDVPDTEDELVITNVPNTYKISIIPLLCLIGAVIIEEKYT